MKDLQIDFITQISFNLFLYTAKQRKKVISSCICLLIWWLLAFIKLIWYQKTGKRLIYGPTRIKHNITVVTTFGTINEISHYRVAKRKSKFEVTFFCNFLHISLKCFLPAALRPDVGLYICIHVEWILHYVICPKGCKQYNNNQIASTLHTLTNKSCFILLLVLFCKI